MSVLSQNISITMERDNLEDVPQFPLPDGYSCKWYEPGNEAAWVRINGAADVYNTITLQLFEREFGCDEMVLAERMCFLRDDASGRLIGTATAWFTPDYRGQLWGRLHWVAIEPAFQGRGLAKPMLTVLCNRLRELGPQRAHLTTSTIRFPAITLYWTFGFKPHPRNEQERQAWAEIVPLLESGCRLA